MATGYWTVRVRIDDGWLWIGNEAFPLRHISHVGQRTLEVDRQAAWRRFGKLAGISLLLFVPLIAIAGDVFTIVLLAVLTALLWWLLSRLHKPALYGLVIHVGGTRRDALWNAVKSELDHLVREITRAIGRPDAVKTTFYVEHAVQGDYLRRYGAGGHGEQQHLGLAGGKAG
ncbi:hypothetical protein TBS_18770 [Thermobispora bispora]